MAQNNIIEQEQTFEIQDDFDSDFDNFEVPQLVRRDGIIINNEVKIEYFILEKPVDKIFEEEQCPICLDSTKQLYGLKCGHTYCQQDIEIMIDISKFSYGLIQCPLCRVYQILDSFEEVQSNNPPNLEKCQEFCH